ncbi:hypothetical protein K2X05_02740 [bacterium]|nr:hypothetical protein [bacterium]
MINFTNTVLALLLCVQSFAAASPTIETIKQLVLEKKVEEAVEILKQNHTKLLRSSENQKQVVQWLSAFQFESSLGLFEKTLEMINNKGEPAEIEKNFLQILEKEPHNMSALNQYIGFLLSAEKYKMAQDKIQWARTELPYLQMYNVFAVWLDLHNETNTQVKLVCDSPTLMGPEKEFCVYVKSIEKIQASKSSKVTAEIRALLKKTTIPNQNYYLWKKWKNPEDKQKYLSSCQSLSGKQRRAYLFVPELCKYDENSISE